MKKVWQKVGAISVLGAFIVPLLMETSVLACGPEQAQLKGQRQQASCEVGEHSAAKGMKQAKNSRAAKRAPASLNEITLSSLSPPEASDPRALTTPAWYSDPHALAAGKAEAKPRAMIFGADRSPAADSPEQAPALRQARSY